MYRVIFDLTPEPAPPVEESPTVVFEPSPFGLAAEAAFDTALIPVREARAFTGALVRPGHLVRHATDTVRGAAKLASALVPATGSSLSGRIGQQRRYVWIRASLADVKTVKQGLGGTVNDVVLAAISSGFRTLLTARGEPARPHMLRSLVPVSVRAPEEESLYENRVSAILAYLPVDLADPIERLRAVRDQLSALKASKEADAGEAIVAMARFVPFPLMSRLVRLGFGTQQREIVTVTTNVPGPRQPLFGLGRRLVEITPYVPIATTLRFGIAIFTYCEQMTIGITGDYDTASDIDVLAHGIEDGISELVKIAEDGPR